MRSLGVIRLGFVAIAASLALILSACEVPITGTTTKVTKGNSVAHGVSNDGNYVLFQETPWGESLGRLVLKNMTTNVKTNVTIPIELDTAFLSSDGRFVSFSSGTDPTTGQGQNKRVYRWDRTTGATRLLAATDGYDLRLEVASPNGTYLGINDEETLTILTASTLASRRVDGSLDGYLNLCGISDDGKTVLYTKNLIMRLRDLGASKTVRTWDTDPGRPANRWSNCGSLSGDGKVLTFWGNSSALPGGAAPDGSTYLYTYSWSSAGSTTRLISKAPYHEDESPLSTTGRFVFFVDNGNGMRYDQSTGKAARITPTSMDGTASQLLPGPSGTTAAFSAWVDPNYLVFRWKQ